MMLSTKMKKIIFNKPAPLPMRSNQMTWKLFDPAYMSHVLRVLLVEAEET